MSEEREFGEPTLPDWLQGEARLLFAEAVGKFRRFTLPDPLVRCTDCGEHAAFYVGGDDNGFYCGGCGHRHSIFTPRTPTDDVRQVAADAALEQWEALDVATTN